MKKLSFILIYALFSLGLMAQTPGTLDVSFGNNGITLTDFSFNGNSNYTTCSAVQEDGKILLAGFSVTDGAQNMTFMRYNPNGTLDLSFSDDGIFVLIFGPTDELVFDVKIQEDGKIVAVGSTSSPGSTVIAVVRLNSDGSLDTSFNATGMKTISFGENYMNHARSVVIQEDGKIIIAGLVVDENGHSDGAICRIDQYGGIDYSFGNNGFLIHDIHLQSNLMNCLGLQGDKIIFGGISLNDNFDRYITLCRYDHTGSLDSDFGSFGVFSLELDHVSVAGPEGQMCMTNEGDIFFVCEIYEDGDCDQFLIKLSAEGILDNSFGNNGMVITELYGYSSAMAVAVQADGKIMTGGFINDGDGRDFLLCRYLENGFLDASFGLNSNGFVVTEASVGGDFYDDFINSIHLLEDGKVVVSGPAYGANNSPDFAIAQYHTGCFVDVNHRPLETLYMEAFPNPIKDLLNLSLSLEMSQDTQIEIISINGSSIAIIEHETFTQGKHQIQWDASHLAPGVYLIKAITEQGISTHRFVKSE